MILVSTSFDRDGLDLRTSIFYLQYVYAEVHYQNRSYTHNFVRRAAAVSEIYTAPMLIENGGSFE